MTETNNPLMCDIETGICEVPAANKNEQLNQKVATNRKAIKVIYFTDPICSSCWGIEPQLRKLKLEYGNDIDIEYRMGGLLPDWNYNSGGISKPSDVAQHWDEVSTYYDMPIDGDVWLEDPLHSSYPPSIAFKAAQMQHEEKAVAFLREIREMVFMQKKNITKWEFLLAAATNVGLNVEQFKTDYEGKAGKHFYEDLELGKSLGVRGFPTLFFVDANGKKELVYGSKPYAIIENTVLKLLPTITKVEYGKTWEALFANFSSLTAKEFSELSGMSRIESERYLVQLADSGKLESHSTKNGGIWRLKK